MSITPNQSYVVDVGFKGWCMGLYLPQNRPITDWESELQFSISPKEFQEEWSRCSLTADFLSHYIVSGKEPSPQVINTTSTIINELIENAVKFSSTYDNSILLTVQKKTNLMSFETLNFSSEKDTIKFSTHIQKALSKDPDLFLLEQINLSLTQKSGSGLGFISILSHFNTKFGVKIIPHDAKNQLFKIYLKVILKQEE